MKRSYRPDAQPIILVVTDPKITLRQTKQKLWQQMLGNEDNNSFIAYCSHSSNWIFKPKENQTTQILNINTTHVTLLKKCIVCHTNRNKIMNFVGNDWERERERERTTKELLYFCVRANGGAYNEWFVSLFVLAVMDKMAKVSMYCQYWTILLELLSAVKGIEFCGNNSITLPCLWWRKQQLMLGSLDVELAVCQSKFDFCYRRYETVVTSIQPKLLPRCREKSCVGMSEHWNWHCPRFDKSEPKCGWF